MTTFDIAVPALALLIAGVGTLIVHIYSKRLDRELAAKRGKPAE